VNPLSSLLPRFSFSADTFFTGEFCGSNDFDVSQDVGHLHFVSHGMVTMEHRDGSSFSAVGPAVVFYPRPFFHRLVVKPGTQAELICANVLFREARINPFALALPQWLSIPLRDAPGMSDVINLLRAEAAAPESGDPFVMDRLCDILVFQLIRFAIKTVRLESGVLAGLADPGIGRALNAIHRNPAHEWDLKRLAAEASMSRSKFIARFHKLVGITPAKYVAGWRLALAEQMLRQDLSVKSVASAVGYPAQRSFNRAFIDRNGMPPTEWLRRQKEAEERKTPDATGGGEHGKDERPTRASRDRPGNGSGLAGSGSMPSSL
jgi:AraC-like DNA-binding protein